MRIKVCGITEKNNQDQLVQSAIDMIGYNFYSPSKRYISPEDAYKLGKELQGGIDKVGVFVNESLDHVLQIAQELKLDYVQLHGEESPEYSNELEKQFPIIKAFGIQEESDFQKLKNYKVSYFLFDTKTPLKGGSGKKFNWDLLSAYHGPTPFLLSGGIQPQDSDNILKVKHPRMVGIDINSRFEIEPGIKDPSLIKQFVQSIKS